MGLELEKCSYRNIYSKAGNLTSAVVSSSLFLIVVKLRSTLYYIMLLVADRLPHARHYFPLVTVLVRVLIGWALRVAELSMPIGGLALGLTSPGRGAGSGFQVAGRS